MLKHLDDPHLRELPPDFRDRVRRRGRSLRRRRRLAGGTALVLVVLVIAVPGLYARALHRVDDIERLEVAGTADPATADDRTVLVVGVDERPDHQWAGTRTDTILIVRLHDDRASVLSVPRDLAVQVPGGEEGMIRINSVAERYGYSELIAAVGSELGIQVDNLVQIDMQGFAALVDLVGGIDVNFDRPTRDLHSGLDVDPPGCRRLDGYQALALARSRHLQVLVGGQWRTDPTGDLGRISRQPTLLAAGLRALARTRPDPLTADRLAGWLASHAAVDESIGNRDLIGLVRTVMDLGPRDIASTTVAVEADTLPNGANVLRAAESAEETVARWNRGSDGPVDVPAGMPPDATTAPLSICHAEEKPR